MHTRDGCDSADGFVPRHERKTVFIDGKTTTQESDDNGEQATDSVIEEVTVEGPEQQPEKDEEEQNASKLTSLVLDMCSTLSGTGRIVNMDNYYTSPEVAVALRKKRIYIRGTCRQNRRGFPKSVVYNKTEAAGVQRGTKKCVVDEKHGLACYGWVDGNPVHFLTSADATSEGCVQRKVGSKKMSVRAPDAIRFYNHGMQAVDRHDQLRTLFSLAERHHFKKYYIKLALGLMDMAVVNAYLHYKLVHPDECKKDDSRYNFLHDLALSLLGTDWNDYEKTNTGRSNEYILQRLFQSGKDSTSESEFVSGLGLLETTEKAGCIPYSVATQFEKQIRKKSALCQVCRFEERGNRLRFAVVCTHHKLRLCTISHPFVELKKKDGAKVTDYSWMPTNHSMTCWEKAHAFYIPKGLFRDNPPSSKEDPTATQNILTSCELYKKKRVALGLGTAQRGKNVLGRLSMKQPDLPRQKTTQPKKMEPKMEVQTAHHSTPLQWWTPTKKSNRWQ